MTAALIGRRVQRQGRGVRFLLLGISAATIAAVALLAVGLAVSSRQSHPSASDERDRAQLSAYEHAVVPLVTEGGKTVELGIKVGIGDLENAESAASGDHPIAPEVVAGQAASWTADLNGLADRVQAISPPPSMVDAHRMFVAALRGYAQSASIVAEAAAASDPAARAQLLDAAREAGRSADQQFDAASALLQAERHRLGLAPSPDFPDPTSS